jgi:hypothetical protein
MQAHLWGLKTFYYSLINKAGSKAAVDPVEAFSKGIQVNFTDNDLPDMEDDCESCKL